MSSEGSSTRNRCVVMLSVFGHSVIEQETGASKALEFDEILIAGAFRCLADLHLNINHLGNERVFNLAFSVVGPNLES